MIAVKKIYTKPFSLLSLMSFYGVRFVFLMAALMKIQVFWNFTPCQMANTSGS